MKGPFFKGLGFSYCQYQHLIQAVKWEKGFLTSHTVCRRHVSRESYNKQQGLGKAKLFFIQSEGHSAWNLMRHPKFQEKKVVLRRKGFRRKQQFRNYCMFWQELGMSQCLKNWAGQAKVWSNLMELVLIYFGLTMI